MCCATALHARIYSRYKNCMSHGDVLIVPQAAESFTSIIILSNQYEMCMHKCITLLLYSTAVCLVSSGDTAAVFKLASFVFQKNEKLEKNSQNTDFP